MSVNSSYAIQIHGETELEMYKCHGDVVWYSRNHGCSTLGAIPQNISYNNSSLG